MKENNPLAISKEKQDMLLEILDGLTFQQWQWLKHDIDNLYETIQLKNVPNCELETFREKLERCYIN